jgi:hypothetical protein
MKNILALLLFGGGFAAWYLYHQHQEAQEGLESAQMQLAELEKNITNRRVEFQAASGAMNIKAKIAAKKAELAELNKKLQANHAEQNTTQKERQATLSAIRQKFIGQTLPMALVSGRDLGQVKIIKMDEAGLSVATTSGVVKVLPNELPPALRAQFLYSL